MNGGRGVAIRCPTCHTVPPKELTGYQRWRWLAAHIAAEH